MKKKPKPTLRELIEINALILLCLYGVKEKSVMDAPQAMKVFVDIIEDIFDNQTKK